MIMYNNSKLNNEHISENYALFLDDMRVPKDVKWIELPPYNWVIVRSYEEFVDCIKKYGLPHVCSLDHDICPEHYAAYSDLHDERLIDGKRIKYETFKEKTGYDAAKWMANYCIDHNVKLPLYYIHTLNPIGAMNILSVLMSAQIVLTKNSI